MNFLDLEISTKLRKRSTSANNYRSSLVKQKSWPGVNAVKQWANKQKAEHQIVVDNTHLHYHHDLRFWKRINDFLAQYLNNDRNI